MGGPFLNQKIVCKPFATGGHSYSNIPIGPTNDSLTNDCFSIKMHISSYKKTKRWWYSLWREFIVERRQRNILKHKCHPNLFLYDQWLKMLTLSQNCLKRSGRRRRRRLKIFPGVSKPHPPRTRDNISRKGQVLTPISIYIIYMYTYYS